MEHFITAGNSGNDIDMLKGKAKGIVVANYSPELEELRKNKFIYFAERSAGSRVCWKALNITFQQSMGFQW